MRRAQRCLFERPSDQDRQLEMEKLRARMREMVDMKSRQYNFDFSTCQPIPGGSYEWEEVPPKIRRLDRQSRSAPIAVHCEEIYEPVRQINVRHSRPQHQQQQQQQQSTTDHLRRTAAIAAAGVIDHSRLQEAVAVDRGDISDVPTVKNFIQNIQKKKAASLESLVPQKRLRKRSFITDYYQVKRQKKT